MASRIVVVTGASGAGKTAIVTTLAERHLAGVTCAFFDSVGVPPPDKMPPNWQEKTTSEWIQRLARAPADVAVLDGQTRPTFALRAFAEVGIRGSVVVLHCAREVRKARLVARGQPELATEDMHAWAAYLCGQADALGFPVIDTSGLDIEQATDALVPYVIQRGTFTSMDYDAELRLHNEVLRRACAIGRSEHVLDIGCGTGLTTREAARRAALGNVLGIDTSANVLALARKVAEEEGLENVSFQHGDAQVHRLPPEYFDVAISRYGTMFFRDPVAAFRNIRGALRPEGRLVMMVWQDHAANEWATSIQHCLVPSESAPIASPAGLDPFSLGDPAEVGGILGEAGFARPTFAEVHEPVYYGENVDAAFEWVNRFLFVRDLLRRLDAAATERAIERLRTLLAAHDNGSGVWFDSRAWIVTAKRQ
jgi:SAM-dependent methyltransferase